MSIGVHHTEIPPIGFLPGAFRLGIEAEGCGGEQPPQVAWKTQEPRSTYPFGLVHSTRAHDVAFERRLT